MIYQEEAPGENPFVGRETVFAEVICTALLAGLRVDLAVCLCFFAVVVPLGGDDVYADCDLARGCL
eukprot:COSAG02_NODE_59_length_43585_cov_39.087752_31_plen_66_part_00